MRRRLQEFLEQIEQGLANASDQKLYDDVLFNAQFLGVATKIEIMGVAAFAVVVHRADTKSPVVWQTAYRYLKRKIERKLLYP